MQNSDIPPGRQSSTTYEQQREDGEWDHFTAMQRAWEEGVDGTFAPNLKLDHEGFPILDPYVFCVFRLP